MKKTNHLIKGLTFLEILATEFSLTANEVIDHSYVTKPQLKGWVPKLSGASQLVSTECARNRHARS